jgi:riboflavin kinase/FMN adenylyltransferase
MHVITIGNFDGVHLGHRALLDAARRAAGNAGRVTAVTFEPLPAAVLRPGEAPSRLATAERRRELLLAAGCDEVRVIDPRDGVLTQDPEAFIDGLRAAMPFDAAAEGPDFRFGAGRRGDLATLRALGAARGFRVIEVAEVDAALTDGLLTAPRSTTIRWLLELGRVEDAAWLLGRPHRLAGRVVKGDQRGRTLGFPTANVDVGGLQLPADGVYAAEAVIRGHRWPAAVSVGTKPTFGTSPRTCEAHVVGAPLALDDYGWTVELDLLRWLREQWRFPGPDALVAQLRADVARAQDAARTAAIA